jgi:hypothetical protein
VVRAKKITTAARRWLSRIRVMPPPRSAQTQA